MPWHPDILDEQERLKQPFFGSVGLHVGIVLVTALYYWTGAGKTERWGDPNSLGGGAVGITPVDKIPLPQRQGRVNPVANDTESQVPAPPKPQPKKTQAPDPDAVALKTKNAKTKAPTRERPSPQKYTPLRDPRPNQVYSSTGQAVTSPMFSQAPGGGGVGSGSKSPFGYRFAWYEQLLRDTVARNWRSQELDQNIRNRVAVTFDIMRDGAIRNVRVTSPSGNFALDQSAQRAILLSNPLRPLPPEFERDVATIEFWFALQQSQ